MSDKATVELVAKAIRKSLPEIGLVYTPTCSWGGLSVDKVNLMAIKIAAALPTPTDARGLVEALDIIAHRSIMCDKEQIVQCARQALAQPRAGNPWSDVVPTETFCRNCKWWAQYSGTTSGDCRGGPPSPRMPIEGGRGGEGIFPITEAKCYCAKWCGPLQPPEGS